VILGFTACECAEAVLGKQQYVFLMLVWREVYILWTGEELGMNRIRISKDRRVPGNMRWIRGVAGTNGKTMSTVNHLEVEDKRTKNAVEWVHAERFSDYVARYDPACGRVYADLGLLKLSKPDASSIDSRSCVYPGSEQWGLYERCIRTVFDIGEDAKCEPAGKPDGASGRYTQIRALVECDANGCGTGVLAVGRDITDV
jgi:hypothetical protein